MTSAASGKCALKGLNFLNKEWSSRIAQVEFAKHNIATVTEISDTKNHETNEWAKRLQILC